MKSERYKESLVAQRPPIVGSEVLEGADREQKEEFEDGIRWVCCIGCIEATQSHIYLWRDNERVGHIFDFFWAISY